RGVPARLIPDQPRELVEGGLAVAFGVRDLAQRQAGGGAARGGRGPGPPVMGGWRPSLAQTLGDPGGPLRVLWRFEGPRGILGRQIEIAAPTARAGDLKLGVIEDLVSPGDLARDPLRLVEVATGGAAIADPLGGDAPVDQGHREEPAIPGREI